MLYTTVNRRKEGMRVVRRMGKTSMVMKRGIDIVLSLLAILTVWPLMAVLAVISLCQNGCPVLYKQERVGFLGNPFVILKFRTMRIDSEADGPKLEQEADSRLTRFGRWMRLRHLDELPQLWNVLRGDMSIVGPRPERSYFIQLIQQHDTRYSELFQVRPGLTSEATLYNGYTNTMEKMLERLEMDLHYVRTATPWTDFSVMFRTFRLLICGEKRRNTAQLDTLPSKHAYQ